MIRLAGALMLLCAWLPPASAQSWTCKRARSCEEAVERWCGGYRAADRDRDGIPCENVCHSLAQVEQAKKRGACGRL